jgi:hypothetical protein
MKLDFRAVSIGAALAAIACLALLPAATAAAQAEAAGVPAQPTIGPSMSSLITDWGQSFAAGHPAAGESIYPAESLPTPGGTATVHDIAPGHLACNSFLLDVAWPVEKTDQGTEISASETLQASVAFVRNAAGQIEGHYFVGSSTCSNPTFGSR